MELIPRPAPRRVARCLTLSLFLAVLASTSPALARPAVLARGFADDGAFRALADGERHRAFGNARLAGATFVRLAVSWRGVAPRGRRKPRGFDAKDPSDRRYTWGELDRAVRESAAAGLEPVVVVNFAPDWAEIGRAHV